MWLFTKRGFFSAVCARQGNGSYTQPVDPTASWSAPASSRTSTRSRRTSPTCSAAASTDYAYRIFVAKVAWSRVVAALADELDYDNFKSEVATYQGRAGREHERIRFMGFGRSCTSCNARSRFLFVAASRDSTASSATMQLDHPHLGGQHEEDGESPGSMTRPPIRRL